MTYSLKGDRLTEYNFVTTHIPHLVQDSENRQVLDIGSGLRARLALYAIRQGWQVTGIDLTRCVLRHEGFTFIQDDFLIREFKERFNLVLNVSSIEHFGIPGRYGVKKLDQDADLKAMRKIHDLLTPDGRMILTIPIGIDAMLSPFHRVYGKVRLPKLLEGYRTIVQCYWAKFDNKDVFKKTTQNTALAIKATLKPHHYYAIGGFVLEAT